MSTTTAPVETAAHASSGSSMMTAEQVMEKVAEELVCVVCGSIFVDPRMLNCQHCFCLRCLFSQALHDRGTRLTIRCAYRCAETTTTTGDIRTLPRNPIISSMSLLLRQRHMEELATRHRQVQTHGKTETTTTDGTAKPAEEDELMECEWCSQNSPSCQLCPYCCSRLCGECRGQFGDHHFLCLSQQERKADQRRRLAEDGSPQEASARDATVLGSNEGGVDAAHTPRFPFLFSANDVLSLVHEAVTKAVGKPAVEASGRGGGSTARATNADAAATASASAHVDSFASPSGDGADNAAVAPLTADVVLKEVVPVRMRCPLWTVECTQLATAFSAVLRVQPPRCLGGLEVGVSDVHWEEDDLGAETLLFLSNMLRLANRVVKVVNSSSSQMGALLEELSSVARKDLITRNRGFQLFVAHVASIARTQVQVARNCLLAHLVRARMMEGLMGDMVANRYAQLFTQSSVPERQAVRQRCVSFLRTEFHLGARVDKIMDSIDAVCAGVEVTLSRILRRLRDLTSVEVLAVSPGAGPVRRPDGRDMAAAAKKCPARRSRLKREGARAAASAGSSGPAGDRLFVSPQTLPASTGSAAAAHDPIFEAFADFTFLGQLEERRDVLRVITRNLLITVEDFLKTRHWTWTYTNTTIRSCGLAESDRNEILKNEEDIQTMTDAFFRETWRLSRLLHSWESFAIACDRHRVLWPAKLCSKLFLTPVSYDEDGEQEETGGRQEDRLDEESEDAAGHDPDHPLPNSSPLPPHPDATTDHLLPLHGIDDETPRNRSSRGSRATLAAPAPLTTTADADADDDAAAAAHPPPQYFVVKYTTEEVREGLENLRVLRSYLLRVEAADIIGQSRGFETQSELLSLMNGIVRSTQQHQLALLMAARAEGEATTIAIAQGMRRIDTHHQLRDDTPPKKAAGVVDAIRSLLSLTDEQLMSHFNAATGHPFVTKETDPIPKTLHLVDFTRRDVALSGCCWFGQVLVDAAHGVALASTPLETPVLSPHAAPEGTQWTANTSDCATTTSGTAARRHLEEAMDFSLARHAALSSAEPPLTSPSLFPRPRSHQTSSPPFLPSSLGNSGNEGALHTVTGEDDDRPFLLPEQQMPVAGNASIPHANSSSSNSSVVSALVPNDDAASAQPLRAAPPSDVAVSSPERSNGQSRHALGADDGVPRDADTASHDGDADVRAAAEEEESPANPLEMRGKQPRERLATTTATTDTLLGDQILFMGAFRECLFAADDTEVCVTEVGSSTSSQDTDGTVRAAELFTKHFRINSDRAVAERSEDQLLPFYIGRYQYKRGAARLFVVDAQTGDVWVQKPESAKPVEKYSLLTVVGSTQMLLFLLVNIAAKYFFGTTVATVFST